MTTAFCYYRISLKYDNQQHFKLLLSIYGVRMSGRHDNRFAFMQQVLGVVDRDPAGAVQAGDKGVSSGSVGADLLALVKRNECDTDSAVLGERFADNLPFLIKNLFFEG